MLREPHLILFSLHLLQSLSVLCNDDTLWKHKLSEEFNFSGQGTARTSGWKFIYRGLFKPRGERPETYLLEKFQ